MTRGLSRARRALALLRVGRTGMDAGPQTAAAYSYFTETRP